MEKVRLELRFFRLSERRLSLGGGGERGHSRQGAQHRERPRGKNSFEQALWSLPPCMRGAGLWPPTSSSVLRFSPQLSLK